METAGRSPRRLLSLVPAAALAALGLLAVPSPRASAASTGHITHYYNDAAHDQQVGSLLSCPHFSHLTGRTSPFFDTVTINCP
jgi:hypothetical protein